MSLITKPKSNFLKKISDVTILHTYVFIYYLLIRKGCYSNQNTYHNELELQCGEGLSRSREQTNGPSSQGEWPLSNYQSSKFIINYKYLYINHFKYLTSNILMHTFIYNMDGFVKKMQSPQEFSKVTDDYAFSVTYSGDSLRLKLDITKIGFKKKYEKILYSQSLPKTLEMYFANLENIFDSFKDGKNFSVSITDGQIYFVTTVIINQNKSQSRKIKLKLEEKHENDFEIIGGYVRQINEKIEQFHKGIPSLIEAQCQKYFLNRKDDQLRKQNEKMREEFEKIKKTFEKKIQTIDWIYERVKGMEDNLKTIDQNYIQFKGHYEEKMLERQFQNLKIKEKFEIFKKQQREIEDDLLTFRSQKRRKDMRQLIKDTFFPHNSQVTTHEQDLEEAISKNDQFYKEFDLINPNIRFFLFNSENRTITYNGSDDEKWFQILSKKPINFLETFTFEIKIIKSAKKSIFVGVVDAKKQRKQTSSFGSGNGLSFYGGGRIWYGTLANGMMVTTQSKFNEGDTVTTIVKRSQCLIEWKVNNLLVYSLYSKILGDIEREFVPFYEFRRCGDTIQILT